MKATLTAKGSNGRLVLGSIQRLQTVADRHLGAIFIVPGLVVLALVIGYPIVLNSWYSLTNKDLVFQDTSFIGFDNFVRTLQDLSFWQSLSHSLIWTTSSVLLQLLLGFTGAIALDRVLRGRTLFRVLLIIPWTFPSIVMAFSWRWMVDPLYGVLNYIFVSLHLISEPVAFLGDSRLAMATVVAMNVWFGFPLMMLALLAGLGTIPQDHYDVARLEGASFLEEIRDVVLPALRNIVGVLLVLRTIWVFNNFDFVYLLTGGGPANSTETLPVYAFRIGWLEHHIGRMAAINLIMIVFLIATISVYFKLLRIGEED